MAFHPPAFLVKVNIEMSMADLILKIARSKEFAATNTATSYELSQYASNRDSFDNHKSDVEDTAPKFSMVRTQEVRVEAESQTSLDPSTDQIIVFENDEQPLHGTSTRHKTEVSSGGAN